ncbi:guanine nucleotide exchange factor BopE [Burkholderia thailandensis MSMB121]|uniref:guanine nucleotide exchange factor BopE n=1 Tax=Burkholderia humptydooensis TaxID=430531 RepID=UPI000327EF8A|nr:guanine nucleotide exchange factor BopE [Burkholderia humptydooensis]AGK49655.1 guanine nucleotide exchange factor BopE [Burkholderia thailandensis MSMB121]ATF32406.1 type III secretion protein BopE [Burkholderia thailandensis]KST72471.1 type III secretion protein BopE [Burkholderia humptydooensis]
MTYNPRIGGFTHVRKASFDVHVKRCESRPRTSFAQQIKRIFNKIGETLGQLFRRSAPDCAPGRVKLQGVRYVGSHRPAGDPKQAIRHFVDEAVKQVAHARTPEIRQDAKFGRQVYEATLCAIFSEAKDRFCMDPATRAGNARPAFVKALGDAACATGLPGADKQGVFTPSGAGTNPLYAEIRQRADTLMGAELAARPEYRELQPYARQQAIDLVASALPAERSDALARFRQTVQTLDATYRRAAEEASSDAKGTTDAPGAA